MENLDDVLRYNSRPTIFYTGTPGKIFSSPSTNRIQTPISHFHARLHDEPPQQFLPEIAFPQQTVRAGEDLRDLTSNRAGEDLRDRAGTVRPPFHLPAFRAIMIPPGRRGLVVRARRHAQRILGGIVPAGAGRFPAPG